MKVLQALLDHLSVVVTRPVGHMINNEEKLQGLVFICQVSLPNSHNFLCLFSLALVMFRYGDSTHNRIGDLFRCQSIIRNCGFIF